MAANERPNPAAQACFWNAGHHHQEQQQSSGYPPTNFPPPNLSQPPPPLPPVFNVPPPILGSGRPAIPHPQYQSHQPPYAMAMPNCYPYQGAPPPPPLGNPSNCYASGYPQPPAAAGGGGYAWDSQNAYRNAGHADWREPPAASSQSEGWKPRERENSSWSREQHVGGYGGDSGEKNTSRYGSEQRDSRSARRSEWRSGDGESEARKCPSGRKRSRSLEHGSRSGKPRRATSSRHEDRRDREQRERPRNGRSRPRDEPHESGESRSGRRSVSRRDDDARSRRSSRSSGRSGASGRTRQKRSRSQESRASRSSVVAPTASAATPPAKPKVPSERELILEKYRRDYCATSRDMERRMNELNAVGPEGIIENERKHWTRTAPADLYYSRDESNPRVMRGTPKLQELCSIFKHLLLDRAEVARADQPPYVPPPRKTRARLCRHKSEACSSSSSDSDSSLDEDDRTMEELMAKKQHPQRLHPEMWFNDPGEMNDGPLCRCSVKSRRSGIRHGIYAGEGAINRCDLNSNNADKLYHYRITISPPTNFLTKTPTIVKHDEHEFIFEGFSMLSHFPLVKLPTCKVIRFNIEYTILYIDEKLPDNFTIQELDYFQDYLFKEILELVDFDLQAAQDKSGCGQFHFMPRFVRDLPDMGQEILSMNEVLNYLIKSSSLLIEPEKLPKLVEMPQYKWQNFADEVKGMVVTYPGKKPCSVRVDQLDRDQTDQPPGVLAHPEIVHFGIRPPQLSYAGNADYQKAWRDYVKFRHLLANMPKPSFEDKRKLEAKENKLQELRTQSKMKRDVTVDVSSEGFYRTGIMCDIVQHAMLIPVLVCHLRFHKSLDNLERTLDYRFKNRYLLQLALTHPSYRENFGTNPDHARNSLTNCGIRQPEYGDRRIHYMNTRKRGINTLINIMSRFGARRETESSIAHNERLEFLGDAVVEFLTSIHLFHMFPDLEEGGLATYRAAIVQNQHLAVLAKKLNLEQYMLYAHGSDLCHDLELRHAMANCFEALMGSLFLDGGIDVADRVFGETLFKDEPELSRVWVNYQRHPLQEQEPTGDRQWIPSFELLQKLTKFEESVGIEFTHIRLLARAFTDRSIGYTNLTLGSNQRLEFLGDTVLQLIVSEYLYKFFPEHHEGHLSLLRSSLVNNKTQAVVCDDLGMTRYALYGNPKAELKTKDRADLLEAFLGALYVDKGLEHCHVFCDVCFFPRLQDFIMNQDWNDPKSKLQQCCLTLRTMDGGEPDIPVYKVIECKGPTNTRVYTVAVYFQGKRLAKASGHSIQEAEMNSAKEALEKSQDLFPQLDHQKRVIAKSMKMQQWPGGRGKQPRGRNALRNERPDADGESSQQQHRKRRSRSRDRDTVDRRSRDRYDSSDRRKHDDGDDGDSDRDRRHRSKSTRKSPSPEGHEDIDTLDRELRRASSLERSKNSERGDEKSHSETKRQDSDEIRRKPSAARSKRKRARSTEKRERSSDDDDNVPKQYRTSNFYSETDKTSDA